MSDSSDFVKSVDNQPSPAAESALPRNSACKIAPNTTAINPVDAKALPLEWLLAPDKPQDLINRVLATRVRAEAQARKDGDVWLADDHRQAFITVSLAARGVEHPHAEACRLMYGCREEELWQKVTERRRAKLGKEYSRWYDENGNLRPDITAPRKPVKAARLAESAEEAERHV